MCHVHRQKPEPQPCVFQDTGTILTLESKPLVTLVRRVSLMSLWDPEPPWLPGGPMRAGGGCIELVALFPGPDLGIGCPPLAEGPVGSNLLRSSLKASSFFDGLSAATNKKKHVTIKDTVQVQHTVFQVN